MRTVWMVSAVFVLALSACADGGENGTAGRTTGPEPAPGLAECTNEEVGYAVQYPHDWHTNPGDVVEACSYFDPEPISVAEGTEPDVAIVLRDTDVAYETTSSSDVFGEIRSRDSGMVNGREAVAVVNEATGEGLLDEGTLTYTWVVNIADGSFIATTHDVPGRDFSHRTKVLDQIMTSINFTAPPPDDGDGEDGRDGGERTVVARHEGFDVVSIRTADALCLVARAGGIEGDRACWGPGTPDRELTLSSLDVPGAAEAIGGLAAPRLPRVLVGTTGEGTAGSRPSDITGTDVRAWVVPVAQSATERVIGYTDADEMAVALDAQGNPIEVLGNVNTGAANTEPSDEFHLLNEVETGLHAGYDRVTFRFPEGVPGYEVSYQERPIIEAGSGAEVEVSGDSVIAVHMQLASGRERTGEGEPTYTGPGRLPGAGTMAMTEVVRMGDYEGVLSWAIGVSDELPFRVQVFGDVLAVDVRHIEANN